MYFFLGGSCHSQMGDPQNPHGFPTSPRDPGSPSEDDTGDPKYDAFGM